MAFHAQSLLVSEVVSPCFWFHREINAISAVLVFRHDGL